MDQSNDLSPVSLSAQEGSTLSVDATTVSSTHAVLYRPGSQLFTSLGTRSMTSRSRTRASNTLPPRSRVGCNGRERKRADSIIGL